MWPTHVTQSPIAKENHNRQLITSPKEYDNLFRSDYTDRLRKRIIKPGFDYKYEGRKLPCDLKVEVSSRNKIPPISIESLELILNKLKTNKSRDPNGYINELFK